MAAGKTEGAIPESFNLVIKHLFPSINYWDRQQAQIIREKVAPEIIKQHPVLKDFTTAADAIKALGAELAVKKVGRCSGFEWMIPPRAA